MMDQSLDSDNESHKILTKIEMSFLIYLSSLPIDGFSIIDGNVRLLILA